MIECPWCTESVVLSDGICPSCKHEVLSEHLDPASCTVDAAAPVVDLDLDLEQAIENRYRCARCGHDACRVKEVAMTGTGISKLIDLQYNHYLFVSCLRCASVEIYDPAVLRGRPTGGLSHMLDLLFG